MLMRATPADSRSIDPARCFFFFIRNYDGGGDTYETVEVGIIVIIVIM